MTNKRNGTLYIGVTSNLARRAYEHRNHVIPGFTKRYNCTRLIWYEFHETMELAITRERQMKVWKRPWKVRRIEQMNPRWDDLYVKLNQ